MIYGLEECAGLPHAISLCGACLDACPVRIYLPRMLLELRAEEMRRDFLPAPESLAERAVAWGLGHERLYCWARAWDGWQPCRSTHDGYTNLPPRLNPAQERRLPALAPALVSGSLGAGRVG